MSSRNGSITKPGKIRTNHHLSWPRRISSSVNDGMDINKVTLRYKTLDKVFGRVQAAYNAGVETASWKIDLKDAYRHIILPKRVAPLLGFCWDGSVYHNNALSFGG